MTKHKHHMQFVERVKPKYVQGEYQGFILPREGHWTDEVFKFICICGLIKNVKPKLK